MLPPAGPGPRLTRRANRSHDRVAVPSRWSPSPSRLLALSAVVLALTGAAELAMGRSLLGPDARFGWIETSIWSEANSQRAADWYSLTHVEHGLIFYGLIWLVARRHALATRFMAALLLESGWEVLENSPVIIDRYREATMALGYYGDSVLNSLSDVVMMAAGFALAAWLRPLWSVLVVLGAELLLLALIRDNLALNVVMLLVPLDAVRDWQMAGAPPGVG